MADTPDRRIKVDLTGQTAIVTGASRGIGRAIAVELGAAGANVACVARNTDKLAEVVSEIKSAGGEAFAIECDATNSEAVQKTVDAVVESAGAVDIMVNNAGITRDT